MKKLSIVLSFIFLFQFSRGQDSIKRFEFGATLITVNSFDKYYYSSPDRSAVEFINGLFFRYTKKRFGLRAHLSYSDNSNSYASPVGWSDRSNGDIHNKDLRVGVGGQVTILKRKDWFYTFLDLSYRNVFSTGHNYGGIAGMNEQFSRTSNGFDWFFGVGFKIKTFKNVYLSPEVGYLATNKFVNESSQQLTLGQSSKYHYSETIINLALKLHLTVRF